MYENCGELPVYDMDKFSLKLWKNKYSEQILCVRDKETGKFWFHHGDCGWDRKYYLNSEYDLVKLVMSITMHKEEWDFIMTCSEML